MINTSPPDLRPITEEVPVVSALQFHQQPSGEKGLNIAVVVLLGVLSLAAIVLLVVQLTKTGPQDDPKSQKPDPKPDAKPNAKPDAKQNPLKPETQTSPPFFLQHDGSGAYVLHDPRGPGFTQRVGHTGDGVEGRLQRRPGGLHVLQLYHPRKGWVDLADSCVCRGRPSCACKLGRLRRARTPLVYPVPQETCSLLHELMQTAVPLRLVQDLERNAYALMAGALELTVNDRGELAWAQPAASRWRFKYIGARDA